ncbi:DEAD/DEAH box helicase [Rossellomorea aquimaris]|uniref:DEAD/DEAH box helicase n=1 Tax=Rossellomorea aquimaris TaxID=189382 RepID=UPI001CD6D348|nr:DEAD/DEAH box helicase [Rossellomorea aquimaris]MCA1053885.1 DEAD/DEAH box helicase [Rossellomorea aquimaris]
MSKFISLGISEEMGLKLSKMGINSPTPIQEEVIPQALKGKDIIAKAQTGSGKTYAFALPILERSEKTSNHIQGIILTPTRELSIQIANVLKQLTKNQKKSRVLAMYGGQSHDQEIEELEKKPMFIVGTPGRMLDHIKRGNLDLTHLNFFVLDEADQMLQIGFLNKVEEIIRSTPKTRQMMLFSATMPAPIKKLANKYMKNAMNIEIVENAAPSTINQFAIFTVDKAKQETILQLVEAFNPEKAVIFCRTKRRVTKLFQVLKSKGMNVGELHGDIPQEKREEVMESFRKGELPLLVATDVASRGLDIEGVTHVFNYDIPENTETYTHRIGRTGRAGAEGLSYTLYSSEDRPLLDKIESDLQTRIQKQNLGNTISLKDKSSSSSKKKKNKRKGSSSPQKSSAKKHDDQQDRRNEGFYSKRPGKKNQQKAIKTKSAPGKPSEKTSNRSKKTSK